MAEEALKKLEDQLNCSICLDTYTDPKQLQCHHVFCQQCLVPLVRSQQSLTCPTCRQVTPLPERGVAGLQSAFHISNLLEIQESVRNLKSSAATLAQNTARRSPRPRVLTDVTDPRVGGAMGSTENCFEHAEEELKLFCEKCEECICFRCVIKGGKHRDHDYTLLNEAFDKHKEEITVTLKRMEAQVGTVEKVLQGFDRRSEEISDQRATAEESVHVTFRRLRGILNNRETDLTSQLNSIADTKLKGLAVQRDQIETSLAKLNTSLHSMRESLATDSKKYVLGMRSNTIKQIMKLATLFKPDILEPHMKADIVVSLSAHLTKACQNYGQVFVPGLPDPSECYVTDVGKEAVVGEESMAALQAVNFEGEPCVEPMKSLECELVSELTGIMVNCGVERRGQSQYEIRYQPCMKGRHQLHIKSENQHVRGSPFNIAVKSPVEKLDAVLLTIDGVSKPWGAAINQRGEVVVTELDGNRVSVFSPSGKKLRSFELDSEEGKCCRPCGVTIDGDGNILVAEQLNHSIQKYTAEGQLLSAVGTEGSGHLQFSYPNDITFNASNNKLYVADSGNCRIHVLNSDLTFFCTFGKAGSDKGQFGCISCIACDSTGKVYVAEDRIQVFAADGKFLSAFGRHSHGMDWPCGIAVDSSGMIYVSEGRNDRVSVFTSKGQFMTSFGRKGEGLGEFSQPRGLAIDNSGVVYVCDFSNCRIQAF